VTLRLSDGTRDADIAGTGNTDEEGGRGEDDDA